MTPNDPDIWYLRTALTSKVRQYAGRRRLKPQARVQRFLVHVFAGIPNVTCAGLLFAEWCRKEGYYPDFVAAVDAGKVKWLP